MPNIPTVPHYVGSYALIRIATGECVAELFKDSKLLPLINFDRYKLIPIDVYLSSISKVAK